MGLLSQGVYLLLICQNSYVFAWHTLSPDALLLNGAHLFGWFFRVRDNFEERKP